MNTYQFKTNINCGGCVAKVTPHLESESRICHWSVDTATPEKRLTVATEGLDAASVARIIEKAGFRAEAVQ
ncbi:MAG TPA: hypothetical protein VHK69_18785 [Chitinophagaceae bacterium]|nr:hypothetical protein [Chitinophagaceae bacterium]